MSQPRGQARVGRRLRTRAPRGSGPSRPIDAATAGGGGGGIRTHGTGVTGTTVFETARFNHSRTPPDATSQGSARRSAAGPEERPQELGGFLGQEPSGDLGTVVQARLGEDVEYRAGGARLRVDRPV